MWIAFLDGEETQAQFDWNDADSTYGSRELAARMAVSGELKHIRAVILADMIGQYNLHILRDASCADVAYRHGLENRGSRLGYQDTFVSSSKRVCRTIMSPFSNVVFLRSISSTFSTTRIWATGTPRRTRSIRSVHAALPS